jgi:hypothetical protein
MYRDAAAESVKPGRVRLPSRAAWYRMDSEERVAIAEASGGLIDPRVAKHGGYRTSSRDNYDFEGMQDDTTWRRGHVHAATSYYGCNRCGQMFTGPHAVVTHLAKIHDR